MEFVNISYISGLSTMFFGMMAWFFWRRGELLHRLVALLTGTIAIESVKDFVFINAGLYADPMVWDTITAIDMVAVPMYGFVLVELIRPGALSRRTMILHELPFVLMPILYIALGEQSIFHLEVGYATIYGTGILIWAMVNIPRYNRHLKELYSYTENINLGWLRVILYTFYVILGIWVFDCLVIHIDMECVYLLCNLGLWMVISYFLYRHELVIGELADWKPEAASGSIENNALATKIEELFTVQNIYLTPDLKLSDIATAVGSNRTYVSNYFNRGASTNFYEYVNARRVAHACRLLTETDMPINEIGRNSGFCSHAAFSRVFSKHKGCSPTAFRQSTSQAH